MFSWFKKSKPPVNPSQHIIDEYIAQQLPADRPKQNPAWAILLDSPFAQRPLATSWFGGNPVAPQDFQWPQDSDGTPLHFIAQLDLAGILPEPVTGKRPPGFPQTGAMLVFIGGSYAIRMISEREMQFAREIEAPHNLEIATKHGFWNKAKVFPKWPVTLLPFLDKGLGRPPELPERFKNVEDWISNWGLAAIDAELLVYQLELELKFAAEFIAHRNSANAGPSSRSIDRKLIHHVFMQQKAPALLEHLKVWLARAKASSPNAAIDQGGLLQLFSRRMALHAEMGSYGPKYLLPGNAQEVWKKISGDLLYKGESLTVIPDFAHEFAEAVITDWRGHRLFGLEPVFSNNHEDLRGQDTVISISSDELLKTKSEHEYGMSIWCKRDAMAGAQFDKGQFIRHCAV